MTSEIERISAALNYVGDCPHCKKPLEDEDFYHDWVDGNQIQSTFETMCPHCDMNVEYSADVDVTFTISALKTTTP